MSSPAEQQPQEPEPSRLRQFGEFARRCWKNRPSIVELWYVYLPLGTVVLGSATAIVDDTFDFGLAETMAEVQVDNDNNVIERFFKGTIRKIGEVGLDFLEDE